MSELAGDRTSHISNQHLVSQVLLRRFVGDGPADRGLLASMSLDRPDSQPKLKGPAGCGREKDFIVFASASAEKLWGIVENDLPAALRSCDDGSVFDSPAHVATIKNAIALHFVRSHQMPPVHERVWRAVRSERRAKLLENPRLLEEVHFARTGLHAVGRETLELAADFLIASFGQVVESGAVFRIRMEDLFQQAREFVNTASLEISMPADGEFLIGDTPALGIRSDTAAIGPIDGIAMRDADTVALPLGPWRLASLGPPDVPNTTHVLPVDMVTALNARQVRRANRYVYFRPQSGLERQFREAVTARNSSF